MNIKSTLTIYALAVLALVISSCNSGNYEKEISKTVENELPPSLNTSSEEVVLVKLSAKEQNELTIQTETVISNLVDYEITAPGVVYPAPDHVSIISTPINGQVIRINANEGSWVNKGQELFRIQSLEFGTLVSEYLQANAEESFQSMRLARVKQLVEETISSASELERATSDYQRALASQKSSYAKLKAIGVTDAEIQTYRSDNNFDPTLKIYSPITGIIESNFIELGQSVNALENLSRVLDVREVLIRGYVSPGDAPMISLGNEVWISKREQKENALLAAITSINPGLDEASRSVVINIILPSVDGWPKPGENLRLNIVSKTQKEVIAIPLSALTYDGNQAVVFVKKAEDTFEKRPISVEEISDKIVFVTSGLKENEKIAVSNVFSLKALLRFDIISEE